MNTLDTNTIVSSAVADLIKASFNAVSSKATRAAKDTWAKLFEDFEPFMKEAYQRNAFVRLLSQKEKDVSLYDVYVKSNFKCGKKIISDDELIFHIRDGHNAVINGNGGAGKTFFMRHLWLTLFTSEIEYTPIFIELRKLNELSKIDLPSFVRRSISRKKEMDHDLFSYFCSQGRFCFILDGYDEVVQTQREALQSQILDLSAAYPSCSFVVSSRYERRFAGWQNFDLFESMPFSLEQVQALISQVPFDNSSKQLFRKQLTEDFYQENYSFLSTPLLAIMMMMTFRENMEIPKRMNIFYDQAFTTLYQWHDATKAFSRNKILDIDDFQRSFAVFCLLSYYKEKFQFTKTEVTELIRQSNKVCSIDENVELILLDYEESVNLLKQDGLDYVFIHRSFQEYFTSYALTRIIPAKFPELLPVIKRRFNDNVLAMCFEMNKGLVVEHYISPIYKRLRSLAEEKNANSKFFYLGKLGVTYNCNVALRNSKGRGLQVGIGLKLDEEITEFTNQVNRIRGVKSFGRDVSADMLLPPGIFQTIEQAAKTAQATKPGRFTIEFADGILVTTSEAETDEEQAKLLKQNSRLGTLLQTSLTFEEVEEGITRHIDELMAWCKSEIDENVKRGKSLDEILALN